MPECPLLQVGQRCPQILDKIVGDVPLLSRLNLAYCSSEFWELSLNWFSDVKEIEVRKNTLKLLWFDKYDDKIAKTLSLSKSLCMWQEEFNFFSLNALASRLTNLTILNIDLSDWLEGQQFACNLGASGVWHFKSLKLEIYNVEFGLITDAVIDWLLGLVVSEELYLLRLDNLMVNGVDRDHELTNLMRLAERCYRFELRYNERLHTAYPIHFPSFRPCTRMRELCVEGKIVCWGNIPNLELISLESGDFMQLHESPSYHLSMVNLERVVTQCPQTVKFLMDHIDGPKLHTIGFMEGLDVSEHRWDQFKAKLPHVTRVIVNMFTLYPPTAPGVGIMLDMDDNITDVELVFHKDIRFYRKDYPLTYNVDDMELMLTVLPGGHVRNLTLLYEFTVEGGFLALWTALRSVIPHLVRNFQYMTNLKIKICPPKCFLVRGYDRHEPGTAHFQQRPPIDHESVEEIGSIIKHRPNGRDWLDMTLEFYGKKTPTINYMQTATEFCLDRKNQSEDSVFVYNWRPRSHILKIHWFKKFRQDF